jgi:hypothetical protein
VFGSHLRIVFHIKGMFSCMPAKSCHTFFCLAHLTKVRRSNSTSHISGMSKKILPYFYETLMNGVYTEGEKTCHNYTYKPNVRLIWSILSNQYVWQTVEQTMWRWQRCIGRALPSYAYACSIYLQEPTWHIDMGEIVLSASRVLFRARPFSRQRPRQHDLLRTRAPPGLAMAHGARAQLYI